MRIIAGRHRSRKLAEFKGEEIRPTADRVKECLFNIISARIQGSTVLDLFCGSGGLGLECISRGSGTVYFNDLSKDSLSVLKKNIAAVGEEEYSKVFNMDYEVLLNTTNQRFDIIFLDPPYRLDYGVNALKIISARGLLNEGGIAIYERDRAFTGEVQGLTLYDERKYGKTYLSFFRSETN